MSNYIFAQYIQQGPKLNGFDAVGNSLQGKIAISSDGNTLIIGGNGDNNAFGAAWIFIRTAGVWTQQGSKLIGTGNIGTAFQGASVSISADGNTAVIGGHGDNGGIGAVWVFTRNAGIWTQQGQKIVGTNYVGISQQGISSAISSDGNTIIIGGYSDNGYIGAAWIYTRNAGIWTQQGQKLVGNNNIGESFQGFSVTISGDGNTAIVGGWRDNNDVGAIWIFTRDAGIWTQQGQKLIGSGSIGSSGQGQSVSISSDGNTAVVGGYLDDTYRGAVWIFNRNAGLWTQQGQKFFGTGGIGYQRQGASVAISSDGNTIIEGGDWDNSEDGAFWIFTLNSGFWLQQGTKLRGSGSVGYLVYQGISVALSSDGYTAIEGGYGDNGNIGSVWVFVNSNIGIHPISSEIPKTFSLSQNYPNPFNPTTKIKFDIQNSSFTSIKIFDATGKDISTLVNEQLKPGSYEISFDGSNYPSGVYFYKLTTEKFTNTKKMVIIK